MTLVVICSFRSQIVTYKVFIATQLYYEFFKSLKPAGATTMI